MLPPSKRNVSSPTTWEWVLNSHNLDSLPSSSRTLVNLFLFPSATNVASSLLSSLIFYPLQFRIFVSNSFNFDLIWFWSHVHLFQPKKSFLNFKINVLHNFTGQFICGNKHCNEKDGLASYEVRYSSHYIHQSNWIVY